MPFFTHPVFVERLRGVEQAREYDLILFNVNVEMLTAVITASELFPAGNELTVC